MLMFQKSRFDVSREHPVATGSTITAEGACLVWDNQAGPGVKLGTGAANEKFAGVALAHQLTPLALPMVEDVVLSGTTASYSKQIVTSSIRAFDVTAGAAITVVSGAPGAGQLGYNNTTKVITYADGTKTGNTIRLYYRYVPTTLEALAAQGNIPAGGGAALYLGTIGVVTNGVVYTSEFDGTVDWTAANPVVKIGAGGLFTIGGSGGGVANANIVSIPTPDSPWLGLSFAV
jgi:hypothetical protein